MTLRRPKIKILDTTGAADGDVPTYDAATDRLVYKAPAAGAGGSAWTTRLAASPMTSLAGWEAKSGTWAADPTYGARQTNMTVQNAYLTYETDLPLSMVAMKATIRFGSASSTNGNNRAGLQLFADDSAIAAPTFSVWLGIDGVIQWDRATAGGGTFASGLGALSINTDYELAVVRRSHTADVYINGVFRRTVASDAATSWNRSRVGLETRTGDAYFRNVSIWTGTVPW